MVQSIDILERYKPECFFCDKEGNPYIHNNIEKVLVRDSNEEPSEAQERNVCKECDPKR